MSSCVSLLTHLYVFLSVLKIVRIQVKEGEPNHTLKLWTLLDMTELCMTYIDIYNNYVTIAPKKKTTTENRITRTCFWFTGSVLKYKDVVWWRTGWFCYTSAQSRHYTSNLLIHFLQQTYDTILSCEDYLNRKYHLQNLSSYLCRQALPCCFNNQFCIQSNLCFGHLRIKITCQ